MVYEILIAIAYKRIFDKIVERTTEEMASEENIEAVAAQALRRQGASAAEERPADRTGPGRPESQQRRPDGQADHRGGGIGPWAGHPGRSLPGWSEMGVCRTQQSAKASLAALQRELQPKPGLLNNLYLHVTFGCQLHCTHCYARADAAGQSQGQMEVDNVLSLIRQAREAGFRQAIITGGEPLVHPQGARLLEGLRLVRREVAPLKLVLRTNFAMPLDADLLRVIALAFDQVVVSVDGTPQTHDQRRGAGSYAATLKNLETYSQAASGIPTAAELSLATVMGADDLAGEAGDSVRCSPSDWASGGRGSGLCFHWDGPPIGMSRLPLRPWALNADPMELIEAGFCPVASCGLGQNLYVEPSGESFPCYAYHQPHSYLGNVIARVGDDPRISGVR